MALIVILAFGFLYVVTMTLVHGFDDSAREREERIVTHGLNARVHEIATAVLPQVMWDDAVSHLDNRFDPAWASENLGTYLAKTGGFNALFLVDGQNRPVYASAEGISTPIDRYAAYSASMSGLIAKVRGAERARGPLPLRAPAGGVLAAPIQASGIARINGDAYIVVATLVQPDFGRARPRGPQAAIVLAAIEIDQDVLDAIGARFMLSAVHLHPGDSRFEPEEAHAPLRDIDGRYVATIDWLPQRPGHDLLMEIGPGIGVIGMLLLGFSLMLYRRSRRMASGLIASEARAKHLAFHDTLTGLPNRRMLFDHLQQALARISRKGGSLAVHCIDLDRFKDINDTLGHLVGDELIRAAAKRMSAQCRASDLIVRLSGDEFAIVQAGATAQDAAYLASRLCELMQADFELAGCSVFTSATIGIAISTDGDLDHSELLRRADLALYRAKADARGSFCLFEQDMDAAVKYRRAMEADLRTALARRELELHYQPQVTSRGELTGVEALLRWRHPDRGDISPAMFVPIAEQSGLICALGYFTLRRAFEDSGRWAGLRISINISANQIRMKNFVRSVRELVEETGVDPADFELEITEGLLLRDDPETHETLTQLRELGFSLVLDDFGTGYSSLSYLRSYPIDKIKIDRSFIASGLEDGANNGVVEAIISLARALQLGVIAEGVETIEQWDWLRKLGCSDAQGYLFGKAVPANEIDRRWHAGGSHPARSIDCLDMAACAS